MTKSLKRAFELREESLRGTGVAYIVTPDDFEEFQCDFELDAETESFPEQSRAYRKARKKALPKIEPHHLKDEIVMLFGPEVSANDAVAYLERMAKNIRKGGLFIGRDARGRPKQERVNPTRKGAKRGR